MLAIKTLATVRAEYAVFVEIKNVNGEKAWITFGAVASRGDAIEWLNSDTAICEARKRNTGSKLYLGRVESIPLSPRYTTYYCMFNVLDWEELVWCEDHWEPRPCSDNHPNIIRI